MILKNKRILVTGAAGTIGFEITKRLLNSGSIVCAFDISENGLFDLKNIFQKKYKDKFKIFLGSIRNLERLSKAMNKVDYVIHCAALKHVEISEYNPFETVLTNIVGVQNIIDASLKNKVKKVIFTSSDKAVNPTSTMGTTKLMGEKLIIAANNYAGSNPTRFASVRFGNVLDSSGSVIKVFKKQLSENKPLTVTSKKMTRFFINIEQAIDLCIFSLKEMLGGEIFFPRMKSFDIITLAKVISKNNNPNIQITKTSIGEKLYEELITSSEKSRTFTFKSYYVVLPEINEISPSFFSKIKKKYKNLKNIEKSSRSYDNLLSLKEVNNLLEKSKII